MRRLFQRVTRFRCDVGSATYPYWNATIVHHFHRRAGIGSVPRSFTRKWPAGPRRQYRRHEQKA